MTVASMEVSTRLGIGFGPLVFPPGMSRTARTQAHITNNAPSRPAIFADAAHRATDLLYAHRAQRLTHPGAQAC